MDAAAPGDPAEAAGDDDALTWAGDDDLAPRERRTTTADRRASTAPDEPLGSDEPPGGRLTPVLAMLAVAALVETALWVQGVFTGPLASTLGEPGGTVAEAVSWAVILVVRIAGTLAPLVWFGVATLVVPDQRRRAAVLLLGVVLLLPWPTLVRLL